LKALEWWKRLDTSQRAYLAGGVIGILVLTALFAYFVLRPSYVPLLPDAALADNATVTARLDAMGADYRRDPDSGRVLVNEEQRDKLRTALADAGGTLRQPKGFEVFDNSDFGMTEFSQRINYERGLEGELTRTIMALDGVRYARLHLVLPESSLFQRDHDQPKASVTLMLAPGKSLSPSEVSGIRELVAYAVPQLKPEMVSIHDYRGADLAPRDVDEEPETGGMRARIKAQQAVDDYLTAKIYDVLVPLYPPGSVAVSVDATLRLDHVSSVRDETLPKPIAPARPRTAPPHPAAHADAGGGVVSAAAAASSQPPPAVQATAGDFGIDRLHQQIDEVPGAIERLSVGVVVPSQSSQKLSVDELRELISGAIGADADRGDIITIQAAATRPAVTGGATAGTSANSGNTTTTPAERGTVRNSISSMLELAIPIGVAIILLAFWMGRHSTVGGGRLTPIERERLLSRLKESLRSLDEGSQVS
jgi:flagellar M-ring protein FliF